MPKLVTCGVTRWVLVTRYYAFKFPALHSWRGFLWGLLANMQEATFDTMKAPELCPVLWSIPGGWLVVMPRADIITRAEWEWLEGTEDGGRVVEILQAFRQVEPKPDSFGRYKGWIVAVDFGGPHNG